MPKSFDRYPQKRGVGNSLYNPLRSGIQGWTDPLGAIDEAAQRAGTGIRQRLEDGLDQVLDGIVATVLDVTGIDISGPVALLEQLIGIPLAFLDSTSLGDAVDVLGQFFPFLPGASGDAFDPVAAAANWVESSLLPLKLLLGWNDPLNAGNLFGLIQMPQLAGGVSLADLTTAAPNLLQPFTATTATDWADGWSFNATENAAQVIADGTTKSLWLKSGVIKVEQGQPLNTTIPVRYAGIVSGAGQTIRYVMETFASSDGTGPMTPVTVAAITNPAGTITTPVTLGDTSWDIPPGVQSVRPALVVDGLVTAGTVYWKNPPHLHKILLGVLADGLPAAIQARINEFQAMLDAFKGGAGGAIADIQTALDKAGQDTRNAIANALGHPGGGHTPADIVGYLMNIPQGAVDGLDDVFGELADILDDQIVDPLTAVGNKLKDLVSRFFFGGGPDTVVSQKQVADASGISPLDAGGKVPYDYLPVEMMSVAMGLPWVVVSKTGTNQAITASSDTLLTGWSQDGPATIIISGNKFKLPFDGMWHLEIVAKWSGSSALSGTTQTINLKQNDILIRDDVSFGTGVNKIQLPIPAATTDEFSVYAFTTQSGLSVLTAGTFIRATYLGMTTVPSLPPAPDPVTFDAAGGGDYGGGTTLSWSHTFGPDANAIVIPISHQGADTPTVTISGIGSVPVLSGPTYLGNYTVYACRYSLAAAILPATVKGTTRTITVTFSGSEAGSANSMSFNGVGALGEVMVSSGSGSPTNPNILVPSNVSSMVACGFGGMNGNFSGFNRTEVDQWNFIEFQSWSHVIGYAVGGQQFTATNGSKWAAKAIELHP